MFLTTCLSTTSLIFFKSTTTVSNLATSKSSTFIFKLFELVWILTNLTLSRLSISDLKGIKSHLAAKSDVSTRAALFNSFLVAKFEKFKTTLTLSLI